MKVLKGIAWGLLGFFSLIIFLAIIGAIVGTPEDELAPPEPTIVEVTATPRLPTATLVPTSVPEPTRTPYVPTSSPVPTPVSGCTGFVISGGEFATLTKSAFEQRLRKAGCSEVQIANSLSSFDQDKARQARWVEQWDHWANVDAFMASMKEINADRVIDKDESARICFLLDQWKAQMKEARDYVVDYRKADSETVEKNPGLQNLQAEAERAMAVLTKIECK